MVEVREYRPADERSWLRCRALSFLETAYFDDVKRVKTPQLDIELVATVAGEVVALMDVEIDGTAATVDTVAVHPDHQRRGLASRLLAIATEQLQAAGVTSLDAWTREDPSANSWYRRSGFTEQFRYLHVYTDSGVLDGHPVAHALMHAPIEQEEQLRGRYDRVYVCRQYLRQLTGR